MYLFLSQYDFSFQLVYRVVLLVSLNVFNIHSTFSMTSKCLQQALVVRCFFWGLSNYFPPFASSFSLSFKNLMHQHAVHKHARVCPQQVRAVRAFGNDSRVRWSPWPCAVQIATQRLLRDVREQSYIHRSNVLHYSSVKVNIKRGCASFLFAAKL